MVGNKSVEVTIAHRVGELARHIRIEIAVEDLLAHEELFDNMLDSAMRRMNAYLKEGANGNPQTS